MRPFCIHLVQKYLSLPSNNDFVMGRTVHDIWALILWYTVHLNMFYSLSGPWLLSTAHHCYGSSRLKSEHTVTCSSRFIIIPSTVLLLVITDRIFCTFIHIIRMSRHSERCPNTLRFCQMFLPKTHTSLSFKKIIFFRFNLIRMDAIHNIKLKINLCWFR